jgi:ArsR family transcriptional regulator
MSPLAFFKCLSEDTRLKTLLLITQFDELCVCDLQEALDVSQPKMSRHLAELRKCELLDTERRGQWIYYRLHDALPDWSRDVLNRTLADNTDYLAKSLTRLPNTKVCEN